MTSRLFTQTPSTLPDRREAGRRLARQLSGYRDARPVVVGVAPEGMPIAAEIASELQAPLDTVAVAELTIGHGSEGRFGVAGEGGTALFDPDRRELAEANPEAVDAALLDGEAQLEQRTDLWHAGVHRRSLHGRTVLLVAECLVDERLAAAAACAVRDRGASRVVYVTPRARFAAAMALEEWVEAIIGLEMIDSSFSAADCFGDLTPVTEADVQHLLQANRDELRLAPPQRTGH